MNPLNIPPMDKYNQELIANTHPSNWVNPIPTERYNLVVIGAGAAGLVTAIGAAGLGAKVALVEKHLLGGDCLNTGCVPSKSLIRSARAYADILKAESLGIRVTEVNVDFPAVMQQMRAVRARISHHDAAQRFQDNGVDVFLGTAHFKNHETVDVNGQTLRFKKAVIATGARATAPPIPGLSETGYLTNETVFNLTQRPQRLACIGAGPIGCELAQTFQRLGVKVTLFEMAPHILPREDQEAAQILQKILVGEGIHLICSSRLQRVEKKGNEKIIYYEVDGQEQSLAIDEILVGAGRAPNVENMNLDQISVRYDPITGIKINDYMQTTNSNIYAVGDVCMNWKFTHAADAAARIVLQNALFWGRKKLSSLIMPWCTYTDPEIAHVGMYAHQAEALGIEVDTYTKYLETVDRAIIDGEESGFVRVHVKKGTDAILGATIVASHAGEMLNELSLAMTAGVGLKTIASVIHPYPTQAEAIKHIGDMYNHTRFTPRLKTLFKWFLALMR